MMLLFYVMVRSILITYSAYAISGLAFQGQSTVSRLLLISTLLNFGDFRSCMPHVTENDKDVTV